jgi:hypothetical protein
VHSPAPFAAGHLSAFTAIVTRRHEQLLRRVSPFAGRGRIAIPAETLLDYSPRDGEFLNSPAARAIRVFMTDW